MKRKRTAQSAPARRSLDEGGFFNLRASITILLCVASWLFGVKRDTAWFL
jgi:hypothetical protein